MIIYKKAKALSDYLGSQRENGRKAGFVPTMGALHAGHISLIETAKAANDCSICSIFVNPTQFNDPTDFEKYPVTIEKDISLLEEAGCDILFLPTVTEIYPGGTENALHYDLGYLETILEGKYRPGHFQGVCKVMHRLLEIIRPDHLYLGQKDYQQCMVITKLVTLIGLGDVVNVNISPTLREADGLAMSSRNIRLSGGERQTAPVIFQALRHILDNLQPGPLDPLKMQATNILLARGFKPDYVEIAGTSDLTILQEWNGRDKLVALAAAYLGDTRLIDNLMLN